MSSRFKSLGAVAACAVSALALSGIAAGSASAACSTTEIKGQGSSLQKAAQQKYWIPGSGCKVTYTSSGSAAGLQAFGVGEKETPLSSGDEYIGTDDAPNGSFSTGQLAQMEKAAKGTEAKPQDLVIPVAQAAIAVMVNPPAGCTITQITNTHLEEVFRGTLKEWKSIATGSGCAGEITRVVRKDGSGTTYQFKHYLFEINSGKLKGTNIGSGERTWAELQEEPQKNIEWPEEAGVLSPLVHAKNSGGGGEAEEVLAKSGSIGYAVLADARPKFNKEVENHYHWVKLQNKGNKVGEEFEYPGTATGEPTSTEAESNCVKTDYVGFNKSTFKVAADQDWSAVYGGNPNGLNAHYSLCTLTWDVGLASYTQAGLTAAQGEAAKEYLQYVVKATGGQEAFKGHDYRNVEEAVGTYAVEMAALVN